MPTLALTAATIFAVVLAFFQDSHHLEATHIRLTNGTNYFIYVDTYEHHGRLHHWGLVAPDGQLDMRMELPNTQFFTDVHVYVKSHRTEDASATICRVTKTFGNTTGKPALSERVHYTGHSCSIDPA